MKKQRNYRLSELSIARLEKIAEQQELSHADIIEELINACWESCFYDFDIKAFEKLNLRFRERAFLIHEKRQS